MGLIESASHGWDSVVFFGLKFFRDPIPAKEQLLISLIRALYKDFLWGTSNMIKYRGKTADFWAGKINTVDGVASYHKEQCNMWENAGLFTHSWGSLGKPLDNHKLFRTLSTISN